MHSPNMIAPLSIEDFKLTTSNMHVQARRPPASLELGVPSITLCKDRPLRPTMDVPVANDPVPPRELILHRCSGVWVPILYANSILVYALINTIAPGDTMTIWLVPFMGSGLLMHSLAQSGWRFPLGLGLLLVLPLMTLTTDVWFRMAYIFVFAVFCSGAFWADFRGVTLVLVSMCWAGMVLAWGGSVVLARHREAHTCQLFTALFLAVLCSRKMNTVQYKVVLDP